MGPLLYDELVPFYHLLDPLQDHEDEGRGFGDILKTAVPGATSLLELGSGAGHGAYFLKGRFENTVLSDISASMLDRSRIINPDCQHLEGDMRTIRLERRFDCALIHDAVSYLTSVEALEQTAATLFAHLQPGGAALLIPDCVKESFKESHEDHAADEGPLGLRALSWSHDPDPTDDTHLGDFVFLLRNNGEVRAVHDRHTFGLFHSKVWTAALKTAGFDVERPERLLPAEYRDCGYAEHMFLARRPPT